jgi:hypothetical protein
MDARPEKCGSNCVVAKVHAHPDRSLGLAMILFYLPDRHVFDVTAACSFERNLDEHGSSELGVGLGIMQQNKSLLSHQKQ